MVCNRLGDLATKLRDILTGCGLPSTVAERWPRTYAYRHTRYTALAVTAYLQALAQQAPQPAKPLIDTVITLKEQLLWGQTYKREQVGAEFLNNYGWTEILGTRGPVCAREIATGLLLLGPHTTYPTHSHAAEEYYLPISGEARWYDQDKGWRTVAPLSLLFHRANIGHGMQTQAEPLLAIYVWYGREVGGKASLH